MRPPWIGLVLVLLFIGCRAVPPASKVSDSKLDSTLAASRPGAQEPESQPEEPQKGFDQEPDSSLAL